MKRMYKFLLGIVTIVAMSFLVSCEGPAGPAGADGINGIDGVDGQAGTVTCLECHSGDNMIAIQAQFVQSQHKLGEFVDYAGGRGSCAKCHSSAGFIEYATFGTVEGSTLSNPGAWECKTCHGLHSTFEAGDYALRVSDPVAWEIGGDAADMGGNNNLCATCHQARTAEPNTAAPGTEFNITSTHYGPHHGPQANLLYGYGFAEIAGTAAYPADGSSPHMGAGCISCHMYDYAEGEGGHTWNPSLAACNSCHTTADFNYGNVQVTVEEKLVELRDLLIAAGVVEYVEADGAYEPITGTHPMVLAQAYYNWIGIEEDRSLGVHNPKYIEALLNNTIAAVEALK